MPRTKISVTLTPERLAQARAVTGTANVSQLLDDALAALIERELERQWLEAHPDDDLPGGGQGRSLVGALGGRVTARRQLSR